MSALLPLLSGGRTRAATVSAAAAAVAALSSLAMAKRKYRRGAAAALIERLDANGNNRPERCRLCDGSGTRPCEPCSGAGSLPPTGFARRNSVLVSRVVGTQWTAVRAIQGRWRHFRCVGKRGRGARDAVAVLSGACGPKAARLVLEVPVAELKKRTLWAGGWVTMADLQRAEQNAGALGAKCSSCSGNRVIICPRCDGLGECGGGL
jgi:tryptophan-rich hypothetical protein